MSSHTGYWSSRFGFLMASIGFAVGLGNIWRFPYMVGENGGSVFIVIYLLCAFLIGVPILMAEIMIGRRGMAPPEMAMENVATESSLSTNWRMVVYLNLLTAFLILFVYSVVAGWVLFYFFQSLFIISLFKKHFNSLRVFHILLLVIYIQQILECPKLKFDC
mgnify:CR=1 FL=1